ncbi:hypothetical protein AZA_88433 [Nitrospirillum viridazoti Y2]|uniref:2-oxoadipate dioxygenase/decarboxylase n=1 Tax=Nitrospirillum amazonense TaxID=28077 RepID=A0A560J2L7_9PROT|nr:DUF1338 family protein [Nitrospirillum amazonense]EGY01749.1 hypothetical protein AZA_88433 [Nitrospirillum amazonense Y2]TWB63484.1 uncharacterized protein DUF1338 [Nitrospirillum amazonense]
MKTPTVQKIAQGLVGLEEAGRLMEMLALHPDFLTDHGDAVPRAAVAQALNMLLFRGLLREVPEGARYVREQGGRMVFDHGALRTVNAPRLGALPPGHAAFARVLEPLGYHVGGTYPLERLRMMGYAYTHRDYPDDIAQFFVSEIFPDRFSPEVQAAAQQVFQVKVDPLAAEAKGLLDRLAAGGTLSLDEATGLVGELVRLFDRHHPVPTLAQYETLLAESAELAWIATEGNRFNHATDRVPDVEALAEELKARGYEMKPKVEVSRNGTVRQTALRAAMVERPFIDARGATVSRVVPGSFYEFISRDLTDTEAGRRLDLRFDSGNAQGIFKMTAAASVC